MTTSLTTRETAGTGATVKGSPLTNAEVDNNFISLNNNKLETSAYTAADVLIKLKTVDGTASGLDADLLDGQQGSYYAAASSLSNYLLLSGGTMTGNLTVPNITVTSDVVISGDLTVNGTTTTINATNLAVSDNMIYLNDGNSTVNIDIGFAGNYNDGTYAHAGLFRDATDGRWKVFDGYTPEPDAAADIDTTHASFNLANIQANTFYGALSGNATTASSAAKWTTARTNTVTLTGDVTGSGSASVDGSGNWTVSFATTVGDDSHSHSNYLVKTGDTATGDVKFNATTLWAVSTADAALQRVDARDDATNYARMHWYGQNDTGGTSNFRHAWYDGSAYINVTANAGGRIDFTGTAASMYIGSNRVFTDNYHPNADKWTTARTNTVTLTGDVTGSGSATVDGTGNWTVSIASTVADNSHNHSNYVLKSGDTMTGDLNITGSESRAIKFILPATYNGTGYSNLIERINFPWYSEYWDIGVRRGGATDLQSMEWWFNGTTKLLELTRAGQLNVTEKIYTTAASSRLGNVLVGDGTYKNSITPIDDNNLNLNTPSGSVYVTTSIRSPIFYDRDDPTYYVDPNSTSNIATLNVATINRSPTVTLSGDVTGSATMTNLGSINITTAVGDDSHNHSNYVLKSGDNMSGDLQFTGTATTTSQDLGIVWTGFDKEGTTDFSDNAYIKHLTNTGGHAGSVLVISSQNDAADGIAFSTNASSYLKRNGNTIWDAGNDGSGSGLDADLLDGQQGSYYLDWANVTNKPDPVVTVTLTGDVTGTASTTLTDLASGTVSVSTAVGDDTHNHTYLSEKSAITYGASYLQWTDLSGQTGTGLNGSTPYNPTNDWYHHIIVNHANNGGYYVDLALCFHTNNHYINRLVNGTLSTVKLWNDGNDGSGSGLDADLLDGQHGSYYYSAGNPPPYPAETDTLATVTARGNVASGSIGFPAGAGYGIKFWNSDSYRVMMGNTSEYHYGVVTDYSIKTTMDGTAGRGFTWGVNGQTPVAAINSITGDMQVAGQSIAASFKTSNWTMDQDTNGDLIFSYA